LTADIFDDNNVFQMGLGSTNRRPETLDRRYVFEDIQALGVIVENRGRGFADLLRVAIATFVVFAEAD